MVIGIFSEQVSICLIVLETFNAINAPLTNRLPKKKKNYKNNEIVIVNKYNVNKANCQRRIGFECIYHSRSPLGNLVDDECQDLPKKINE